MKLVKDVLKWESVFYKKIKKIEYLLNNRYRIENIKKDQELKLSGKERTAYNFVSDRRTFVISIYQSDLLHILILFIYNIGVVLTILWVLGTMSLSSKWLKILS